MYINKPEIFVQDNKYLKLENMYCLNKDVYWIHEISKRGLLIYIFVDLWLNSSMLNLYNSYSALTLDIKGLI